MVAGSVFACTCGPVANQSTGRGCGAHQRACRQTYSACGRGADRRARGCNTHSSRQRNSGRNPTPGRHARVGHDI